MSEVNTFKKEKRIVDMTLTEKITEFFEPVLGARLGAVPPIKGILATAGVALAGMELPVAIAAGVGTALVSFIFDRRNFSGLRSSENY